MLFFAGRSPHADFCLQQGRSTSESSSGHWRLSVEPLKTGGKREVEQTVFENGFSVFDLLFVCFMRFVSEV